MARIRKSELAFDAITLEGSLISPAKLTEVAERKAGQQTEADYNIPKGLTLRDETARYFRIGQALFRELFSSSHPSQQATIRFTQELLRDVFGFADIEPTPIPRHRGDRTFVVSLEALKGRVPVVVVPPADDLDHASTHLSHDRRRSAATSLQDWLNADENSLWGLCCNGEHLRLLRDNESLTRPAYLETNLRQIFESEDFAGFAILWLIVHASRFGRPGSPATDCALERWREAGTKEGLAARERLSIGVKEALLALGNGFLSHPANTEMRDRLTGGQLALPDFFNELLRLVYRLIFLLAAEDRGLLHQPEASEAARKLYAEGYSLGSLRDRAIRRSGWDQFHDRWEGLLIVFRSLADGELRLGLPALGGLFEAHATPALDHARLSNRALMEAILHLAWLREDSSILPVNWRDMETEELGSVYEGLLELTPRLTQDGRGFAFAEGLETKGNERKKTGNHVYDHDIRAWTERITDRDLLNRGGQIFRIRKTPIYAGLTQANRPQLPETFHRHASLRGVVYPDAKLVFASASGNGEVKEANPLLGLVRNRPWDYPFSTAGVSPSTEVAAVCPKKSSHILSSFLSELNSASQATNTERDYLQDFPGFSAAFWLPLILSHPGDPTWHDLHVDLDGDPLEVAKRIARGICAGLDRIRSLKLGAIAIVYVPTEWAPFEIVNRPDEHFNLHDFVKAYAARNGQSTQLVREKTVVPKPSCRVKWWLSLAFYAKTMRTPWRLECLDDDSAFVGIGYSYDAHSPKTSQILLGCSHIYSARGEGLQFRLGRIENPIIRGRNPYMSLDDARRTGETIRQLFYEARMRLPRRVVIHKRTHFTSDEQSGLAQGLEGVQNIELIEVNTEESIRFLASKVQGRQLAIDTFPMPRGAAIVLADNAALLWVHGHAPSVQNPNFKYFQGKRRIPAPLFITRFRGESDLSQVAAEILGLSKMNWNHFDYYSRLPASLDSASAIARVGQYLNHFGSAPYDYRLLI